MDGAFNALAAEKEKARQQKQEFDGENERRPSLSVLRPALMPAASAGFGWRFAESHILSLPAADAMPEREAERAVFKSLGLAMSIVFHVFGKRNELVRRAY